MDPDPSGFKCVQRFGKQTGEIAEFQQQYIGGPGFGCEAGKVGWGRCGCHHGYVFAFTSEVVGGGTHSVGWPDDHDT